MNGEQISKEIIKVEREIAELKREYKNLLAKTQVRITPLQLFILNELNYTESHNFLRINPLFNIYFHPFIIRVKHSRISPKLVAE